ncbi:hypothetical protein Ato02nite_015780 [Paractinoplanes toevensis]|uniref:Uncharacterized protein n=1 Tax=Paractinoplanes toevensis TaxID=571911 RepID=A0A919T8F8_9ACTN|nr:hypothetical protein Ato02nite_015780 [Actinoplanes toevensis]
MAASPEDPPTKGDETGVDLDSSATLRAVEHPGLRLVMRYEKATGEPMAAFGRHTTA